MKVHNDKLETVVVDGVEYSWVYRHGWGIDYGFGIRGVSVSVWLEHGRTRELILDFPFSVFGLKTPPKRTDLLARAGEGIRLGLEAGWKPESRGKAFRYLVPKSSFINK